jgi:hypothetical protein
MAAAGLMMGEIFIPTRGPYPESTYYEIVEI